MTFVFRLQSSHWKVHFSYNSYNLKILNSYLANLKYWRKSLRCSIFTSSKKLKGTKGYCLGVFSALWDFFSKKTISQRVPCNFFWSFPTERMLKNPKGSPFQFFGFVRLFFKKKFSPKVPLLQFFWWFATEWMKNFKVSPLVRQFGSTFGFFRYRRRKYFEVLLLFLSLRYGADLGVPGLFKSNSFARCSCDFALQKNSIFNVASPLTAIFVTT